MTNNHAERAHAILSPSFLHIAIHCAGSVGLKEKLPQAPTSAAAALGTLAHEAAERELAAFLRFKRDGGDLETTTYPDAKIIIIIICCFFCKHKLVI